MTAISSPLLVAEAGKLPVPIAPEVSVVMPCLNEAETLRTCIEKALRAFRETQIDGEVVVADNGSTDGSPELARSCGARVVHVESRGYGAALTGGIDAARGKYVIMGDADDSYDFWGFAGFSPAVARWFRSGDGQQVQRRNKARCDAGATPISWQPGSHANRTPIFQISLRGFSLRTARLQSSCLANNGTPDERNGICKRNGSAGYAARHADYRSADDSITGWEEPSAASPHMARRLAPSSFSAFVQSTLAFLLSGNAAHGNRCTGCDSRALRTTSFRERIVRPWLCPLRASRVASRCAGNWVCRVYKYICYF